ncbi:MAG: sensor histidine kinase, partial [Mycobacterium sp.]
MGISVYFSGQNYHITAERLQILDLLLSTYENAYRQNCELLAIQEELTALNERLEETVQGRDAEIAERKKTEVALRESEERYREQNAVLQGMNRIFRETLACDSEQELGRICLDVAEKITESEFGFIGEIGPDGLLHDIAISETGWEMCTMYDKTGHRRPPGNFRIEGLYGRVLRDGKSLLVNDPSTHPDSIGVPEGHPQLTCLLGIPLTREGQTIGMIAVANREGGYRQEDLESLESLSPAIVEALARKRAEQALKIAHNELEGRVEERTEELRQAYDRLTEETREKEQLEQELRQAQKLEALGTLSGGIAHDFNNILAAIIGFTELLAEHAAKGSRDAHRLERIMEAGVRGRELVRQMLTFSRKTEQKKKPLRVSSIVEESVKLIRATTPTTISIKVNTLSESGLILGDPTQIQQVLMNLCANASYAMREKGGTLYIELSDYSASLSNGDPHRIKPGLYARLTVRDTGTGMSPDIVNKIFDPFFT